MAAVTQRQSAQQILRCPQGRGRGVVQVQQGQTVGLIGPNGAGKSTTVSMICGLLRSDSGRVLLDGDP
jgi:ABC-type lipopolysaccharide export system ATPase subunit